MSRYRLHVAEQVHGATRFQTQEADTEQEAASAATLLAQRGLVVWLYRHEHAADGAGAFHEVGMFIGRLFLATRTRGERGLHSHEVR